MDFRGPGGWLKRSEGTVCKQGPGFDPHGLSTAGSTPNMKSVQPQSLSRGGPKPTQPCPEPQEMCHGGCSHPTSLKSKLQGSSWNRSWGEGCALIRGPLCAGPNGRPQCSGPAPHKAEETQEGAEPTAHPVSVHFASRIGCSWHWLGEGVSSGSEPPSFPETVRKRRQGDVGPQQNPPSLEWNRQNVQTWLPTTRPAARPPLASC